MHQRYIYTSKLGNSGKAQLRVKSRKELDDDALQFNILPRHGYFDCNAAAFYPS